MPVGKVEADFFGNPLQHGFLSAHSQKVVITIVLQAKGKSASPFSLSGCELNFHGVIAPERMSAAQHGVCFFLAVGIFLSHDPNALMIVNPPGPLEIGVRTEGGDSPVSFWRRFRKIVVFRMGADDRGEHPRRIGTKIIIQNRNFFLRRWRLSRCLYGRQIYEPQKNQQISIHTHSFPINWFSSRSS